MRLCSPREVVLHTGDTAFYSGAWRGLLAAACIFGAIAGYAAIPKGTENTLIQAMIPGLIALYLVGLAAWNFLRLGLGNGWRMALARDGIYLRLQEGTKRRSSGQDMAVFFEHAYVDHVRLVTEEIRLPHRFGVTRHHIAYIDFQLTSALDEGIRAAWRVGSQEYCNAGHSGPFPVLLPSEHRVRICWGGLYPGENKALAVLASRFRVLPALRVVYPSWEHLALEQQTPYVRMIWDMGLCADAIFILRMRRGLSRSAARSLLEGDAAADRSHTRC